MSKNRIKPKPPSLGNSKITMQPRATQGYVMFFENDLPLQGIIKETNNYPIPVEIDNALLAENGNFLMTEDNNYITIEY